MLPGGSQLSGGIKKALPGYMTQPSAPGGTPPDQKATGNQNTGDGNPSPNTPYSIPNSEVYLNAQNEANKAYEDAKSQLLSQRNSLYHQYGLTETGAVDPFNQYGDYQMLLGREGSALDSARNDAAGRGLGGGGLGNQEESGLRFAQGADNLAFQRGVDQIASDYGSGLMNAQSNRTGAINQGYQNALQDALARGLFDPSGPSDPSLPSTKTTSKTPSISIPRPGAYTPYAKSATANKTGASANKRQGIFSIH